MYDAECIIISRTGGEAYFERTTNSLGGRPLGPWGIAYTNAAGHELRSLLLSQNLRSIATFFRNKGAYH